MGAMGRLPTITEQQLFQAAESLLLEAGYAGFHFKALAEKLGVARSTIYNYYPKKEVLITAFMVHQLNQVVEKMDAAAGEEEPVRALIQLWGRYANMHQMLQVMPYIDQEASEKVKKNMQKMFQLLQEMREKIMDVLAREQKAGRVRSDIDLKTMTGLIMSTVQIPVHHQSEASWSKEVYTLVSDAIRA
ncbi:TetR/AcrR family transcriptional regulator [Alkalicoccus urumqiensis]|uniref:HTH tetR-type domain-containing protein n=1 Tax=Alkalicoccus urumqiensis TaxID=1548213 RepID=A0A2P6MI55_ALKUR|nr:TetR/AcrR family transcriptional regulator [Alkalicoccus urumqiensis]PRO65962.1 hypothetical protein C6I21_06565 [Alkalicoccus urumqiensis]